MNTDNLSGAYYFATIVNNPLLSGLRQRDTPVDKRNVPLKIIFVNLEVALRMCTYRANLRCFGAYHDMAAVSAFPNLYFALFKYLGILYIL